MNKRQSEKQRKESIVYSEIVSSNGKTARDISRSTGITYPTVLDIIERLRNNGAIESLHTTGREGRKHRAKL